MRAAYRSSKGFSLVETMIAIAIIVILAGLVISALIHARSNARQVDNISRLKQLGIAAEIYHAREGEWPLGTAVLVDAGLVPSSLCLASNDSTRMGLANALISKSKNPMIDAGSLLVPYKSSFIGLREYGIGKRDTERWLTPDADGGWLIDATPADPTDAPFGTDPVFWRGRYRRLLFDGSVRSKSIGELSGKIGKERWNVRSPLLLFMDPTERFLQWVDSH
jgi:prepilin-type N-terminal cleavage/methylation domain-containing protein